MQNVNRGVKSRLGLIGLLLLASTYVTGVQAAQDSQETTVDRIVAVVDDGIITETELDREVKLIQQQISDRNTAAPPLDILRKQVLEREIVKRLQLQLAKNTGIIVDDNTLNSAVENIAAQNKLSLREFRDVLERDGYDFPRFREDIRDEIVITRLHQREIQNRVTVTDQEIDNFLATQTVQGNANDEYHLAHILVALPEAATPDQIQTGKKKADAILAKLRGGADFAQTAIAESEGKQALEGGDLGWRKGGELPTLFTTNVLRMKEGDISDPIRSPSGFHIIKLLGKRAGEQHIINQTHARHILIRTNELVSERDAITKLRQLKERIENGDDFAELARSHSDDRATAAKGGDLGWTSPGDLVPQFEQAMDALKPKQVSEPFQTPFGWHIVQVLERRKLDNSKEYQRSKAREFLRQRKSDEMLDAWLRQLRDEAYVENRLDTNPRNGS